MIILSRMNIESLSSFGGAVTRFNCWWSVFSGDLFIFDTFICPQTETDKADYSIDCFYKEYVK